MTTIHPSAPHPAPRPARRRRWRAVAAASVLALAPVSLAACGGDGAASATGSGEAASSTDLEAFQQCLAENGVEMGAPPQQGSESNGTPPSMPDQDAMQQAQEACADLAPEGMGMGQGQGGPGMGAGGSEEMQAYTECLSENGVDVATPGAGGGEPPSGEPPAAGDDSTATTSGAPFGLDTSDPEVAAAVEACADLEPSMPSGGPGGSGGSGATDDTSSSDDSTQSS